MDPDSLNNDNIPITNIHWGEAKQFCSTLTQNERDAGRLPDNWSYGLPTEAQWEYACRAGTTTAYFWGDDFNSSKANSFGSGNGGAIEVGSYAPNAWGIFDMHGNVWELTADYYLDYSSEALTDPMGAVSGDAVVMRGGSYSFVDRFLRSARRGQTSPTGRSSEVGFRVCLIED
jgi:formylglycine-generating enzyme required for sulfatase activity